MATLMENTRLHQVTFAIMDMLGLPTGKVRHFKYTSDYDSFPEIAVTYITYGEGPVGNTAKRYRIKNIELEEIAE